MVPTAPTWPGRAQTSNRQEDNQMKTAIQIEVRPTELDSMGHVIARVHDSFVKPSGSHYPSSSLRPPWRCST